MKIRIQAKPNARKNEVITLDDGTLIVRVTSPPEGGKANEQIREVLSEYFGKPKSNVTIVFGTKGKHKIVEVN